MAYDRQKVIDLALGEVGYLEKATNDHLDDKTANAGKKNYTRYARDLAAIPFFNGSKTGIAWCAVFVCWCFVQAFGVEEARKLLCQPGQAKDNCAAGCNSAMKYFKSKGRFFSDPEPGDQVFFGSGGEATHTGLVVAVEKGFVHTVEGNTSGASGVVANGGGVCRKKYALGYGRILGYGSPDYGLGGAETASGASDAGDGEIPGQEAGGATAGKMEGKMVKVELPLLREGCKGSSVRALQRLLRGEGYEVGTADGVFGVKTRKGVRAFQEARGLEVDGVVGAKTWGALVG